LRLIKGVICFDRYQVQGSRLHTHTHREREVIILQEERHDGSFEIKEKWGIG